MVSGDRTATYLIVNADDFGLTTGVNRGVIRAYEEGIVTSTSLMVRPAPAADAARYAQSHPRLDIGLHLDLWEWAYRPTGWEVVYQLVDMDDAKAVARELERQVDTFRELVGRDPSHLDSHQHAHRSPGVAEAVEEIAQRLGLPVRESRGAIRYCGDFYGESGRGEAFAEGITVAALLSIIEALPPGITELACHPGDGANAELPVHYGSPRVVELETLCNSAVRAGIERRGVVLTSFAVVAGSIGRTRETPTPPDGSGRHDGEMGTF